MEKLFKKGIALSDKFAKACRVSRRISKKDGVWMVLAEMWKLFVSKRRSVARAERCCGVLEEEGKNCLLSSQTQGGTCVSDQDNASFLKLTKMSAMEGWERVEKETKRCK